MTDFRIAVLNLARLRLNAATPDRIGNRDGWLTTLIVRTYLDMLGSRTLRREELAAHKALLADSAGLALLVFLEKIGSRQAARVRIARHVRRALRPGRFHHGAIAIGGKAARKPHWPSCVQRVSKVPDANLGSQPEVVDAFRHCGTRRVESPHFLAVGSGSPGRCL